MSILVHLRDNLSKKLQLTPLPELNCPESAILQDESYDFVGVGSSYGSMIAIGLVLADTLDHDDISSLSKSFSSLVFAMKNYAMDIGVQLGSFGVLYFVFENPPEPNLVLFIQKQKHRSLWKNIHSVCWTLDLQNTTTHPHKGFPLTMPPGVNYINELIGNYKINT